MQETLQQSSISLARSDDQATGFTGRGTFDETQSEQGRGGSVDFDQLDKEREAMDFEGLDDFLKGVEGNMKDTGSDLGRIKSLEKSLEDEKRRLASMELQLRDAKKKRESDQQMVVVQKQSKVLAGMFGTLTKATRTEVDQRQRWEAEWRSRFDDFNRQHREMEDALKRKHVSELKGLQDDIQKSIKRVALEVQKTRGQTAPSPRTMTKISENNMERLVSLYHKHGQERLFLASKIARQEEVLVRSKNQSLQRFIVESQGNCNRLYRKFNLPTSKSMMKQIDNGQGQDLHSEMGSSSHMHSKKKQLSQSRNTRSRAASDAPRSRSVTSWAASTGLLPSPRINDTSLTFLTEIGGEEDMYSPPHQHARHTGNSSHTGFQPSAAPPGSMAAMSRTMPNPLSRTLPASTTQSALSATYSAEGGGQGSMLAADALSPEFGAWGKAAPPAQEGRPRWDNQTAGPGTMGMGGAGGTMGVPPPQWHPNIIAFEASGATAGTGKGSSMSPYLGMTGGLGGMPKKAKGATGRSAKAKGRGGGAKGRGLGQSMGGGVSTQQPRAMSTQPRLEQTSNPFGNVAGQTGGATAGGGGAPGSMALPYIADRKGARVQATDANLSRPFSELTTHDDLPTPEQKLNKLENWIEDKIRAVLGDEGSRTHILGAASKLGSTTGMRSAKGVDTRGSTRGKQPGSAGTEGNSSATPTSKWERAESGESFGESMPAMTPVSTLMGKLAASMVPADQDQDPEDEAGYEDGEPGEGNAGFVVQDADERVRRRRRDAEHLRGTEVEQDFEETPVQAAGKTKRDGTHVELAASADVAARRHEVDSLSRKSAKRVGWDLSDGEGMGYTTGGDTTDGEGLGSSMMRSTRPETGSSGVSGLLTRPETTASSYGALETEPEDNGREGGGEDEGEGEQPSRKHRARGADEEERPAVTQEVLKDLFSKVRHNKVPEVEEVLARGFPIEQRDAHGNTPLMVAAQNGHKRLVKMCLRYGADPNAGNHQGNTALHFATSYGYTALSKYLVSKGGDDTLINLKGLTCYDGIG